MVIRSNKILDKHINKTLEKGFNNSFVLTRGNDNSPMVVLKLQNTPLSFMYGWENDQDYWVLSEN